MAMTESQKKKINELISILPETDKVIYGEIAKYAAELGYSPAKVKNMYDPVIFAKTIKKYGYRRLCRITPPNPSVEGEQKTTFVMSFYAASNYSEIFHEAVKNECESRKEIYEVSDFSEVYSRESEKVRCGKRRESCDECRKCKGYYYTYPSGKTIGCCHTYLIELPPINAEHVAEIKGLLKIQHECWTHHL